MIIVGAQPIDTRTHEGLHERPHYLFAGNNLSDLCQSNWYGWTSWDGVWTVFDDLTNRGGHSKDEDMASKLCALRSLNSNEIKLISQGLRFWKSWSSPKVQEILKQLVFWFYLRSHLQKSLLHPTSRRFQIFQEPQLCVCPKAASGSHICLVWWLTFGGLELITNNPLVVSICQHVNQRTDQLSNQLGNQWQSAITPH